MNEYGKNLAIVVVSFARTLLCVMNEMKNMLCFNFVGNNFTTVANNRSSEI